MCGIAGGVIFDDKSQFSINEIEETIELIRHRGPDDNGFILGTFDTLADRDKFVFQSKVCLIHTRLSINDLSHNGKNPLTYPNSAVNVIFNGEIYNFKELRDNLSKKGYKFFSNTDTEVLLVMYLEYGDNFVEMLDGMFAVAIWDFKLRKLKLFRDRIGIKPLYYLKNSKGFFFASEIKALLKISCSLARLDSLALAHYLQFQNQIDNRTMFADVFSVEPGSCVTIEEFEKITHNKWWFANITPNQFWTLEKAKLKSLDILSRSLEYQMVSDVPVGSYLSGGLDSALIAAVARAKNNSIPTYTIGFSTKNVSTSEKNFSEIEIAKVAAKFLRIDNIAETILPSEYLESWTNAVVASEDLRVGPSVQVMKAAKLASKYSVVVLSGAGGDELFGGYLWRYPIHENDSQSAFSEWFRRASRLLSETQISVLFKDSTILEKKLWNPKKLLNNVWNSFLAENSVDKSLLMDLNIFLPGLLMIEDKLSMHHSIEVRVPFLSNEMVNFALSLPYELKISEDYGKIVLREIAKDLLPKEFSNAPKQGFTPPLDSWFKHEYRNVVNQFIVKNSLYLHSILDIGEVSKLVDEHNSGAKNHRMLIWSLISVEIWGRYFILGHSESRISTDLVSSYRSSANL